MDGKELLFSGKVSRRDFMKTCMVMSAAMGLPYGMHTKLAEAAMADDRPPVIWLHFQECTGCSESLIRAANPSVSSLLLDMINLEYHETLMPGAGHQAEETLLEAMKKWHGKYILIAEGAIPTNDNGIYCKVAGKTAIDSLKEAAEGAAAIIAVGTCASSGGVAAASPNPTGAKPAHEILTDKTVVNIPGCPPNTYNMTGTILYYLAFHKLPELDELNRPKWAYGRIIHEHCERRPHFDAGRFVQQYGDQGHKDGYCLFKMGCKGPVTHANCNTLKFNDMNVWPVSIGHACVGCTEPGVAFNLGLYERVQVHQPTPPDTYPSTQDPAADRPAIGPAATGVVGLVGGAVLGAAAMTAKKLPKDAESVEEHHE
jgi:hydrogenase small subunit